MTLSGRFDIGARLRWHARQFGNLPALLRLVQFCLVAAAIMCLIIAVWARHRSGALAREDASRQLEQPHEVVPSLVPPIRRPEGLEFPAASRSSEQLQALFDVAEKAGIRLQEGDYRLRSAKDARIQQMAISLPLTTDYEHLQKFLAAALYQMPNLGLESLQLQREKTEQAELNVKLQLFLYLSNENGDN